MDSTVFRLIPVGTRGRQLCSLAPVWCLFLSLTGAAVNARAGFVGYYAVGSFVPANSANLFSCDGTYGNFTLSETGVAPDGCVSSPDTNTLILIGPNDGSGAPGSTTFSIPSAGTGWFQFNYIFNTANDPTFESAGYLIGGTYTQLANSDGQSSSVAVQVLSGQIIGFQMRSFDDTGGAGMLTVTNFSAPNGAANNVPEPGGLKTLGVCAIAWLILSLRKSVRVRRIGISTLLAAGIFAGFTVPANAQQVFYSGANVTGQFSLIGTVNFRQQALTLQFAQALGLRGGEVLKSAPLLRAPLSANRLFGAAVAPPLLPGLSVATASGIFGFNALSHLDQRNANSGNQFSIEPPNQSIAVGNGFILEGVNDAIEVYTTSGTPALPVVLSANQVFGLGPAYNQSTKVYGVYLTDMRVFYDQDKARWFVVMRSQDEDTAGNYLNRSHLYMAVSQTSDPTASYNVYSMDTTNANHVGCPCVDDYPQIGADQYGFHIAWNEFNTPSLQYLDAAILSISKTNLVAGAAAPTAIQFILPAVTGFEMSIQPASVPPGAANFVGNGGVEYFVSTSSSFTQNSQVALWAMSNTSSLATPSPNPTLTRTTISTLNYSPPVVASQPPGYSPLGTSQSAPTEFIDGGDCRVQALTYAGGRLYLTFPTELTDSNGRFVVGGAYAVLSPTYRSGVLTAQVVNQGYLLVTGNHLLRPAIAVNPLGVGAIAVTLVGSAGNYYPTAAFIPFSTYTTPTTVEIAAAGAFPEDGFSGYPSGGGDGVARWGDYNTAVAASDGAIWMVVQYIGNYPRTTYANWNTYIIRKP